VGGTSSHSLSVCTGNDAIGEEHVAIYSKSVYNWIVWLKGLHVNISVDPTELDLNSEQMVGVELKWSDQQEKKMTTGM